MIYLTTGANGAGKTLLMLADVRKAQLATNRPVYFNGFEAGEKLTKEFGWQWFDPKKWQDLPDGSICVMDECQNEFPLRRSSSDVPDYVNAVAQFRRKRGFDFWMTTPHPMLLDVFIRRLIDNPSWHRHIKRTAGAQLVSVLKWNAVNTNCEKPGSGDSGEVTMVPYPKEVFDWYKSASLHTSKTKIPRAVYVFGVCAVLVPALGYFAVQRITRPPIAQSMAGVAEKAKAAGGGGTVAGSQLHAPGGAGAAPLTRAEYIAARSPRIEGFPFSAPAYDALTQPQDAPYPAACLDGVSPRTKQRECTCFTQQGTKLRTPADMCRQIVAQGFFMDWHKAAQPSVGGVVPSLPAAVAPGRAADPVAGRAPASQAAAPQAASSSAPVYFAAIDVAEGTSDRQAAYDGAQISVMRRGEHRAP